MRILYNLGSISCASSAAEAVIRTQDTIGKPKVCLDEGSGPLVTPDLRSADVYQYARNLCLGRKVVSSIGITATTCCVLLSIVLSHVSGGRHPGIGHWSFSAALGGVASCCSKLRVGSHSTGALEATLHCHSSAEPLVQPRFTEACRRA